jgi:hypothetical protein
MDRFIVDRLLDAQSGVIARRQILGAGGLDADVARMLRRRELARVHDGVFVNHTGPLGRDERCWAAVLYYWPAALCHRSALDVIEGARAADPVEVHVAIDSGRRVAPLSGVVVHRLKDFGQVALMNLSPPRIRIEHAALEVASSAPSERRAVGVLAAACQSRRTTATRLLDRLDQLPRLRRRRLLRQILADVSTGAYSVLERMFLRDVERPHGLPTARRQRRSRVGSARAFRDVEYLEQHVVVELDGRLGHEWPLDRWADLDRDVAAAVDRLLTIRLGYGQVLEPCRVAAAVARILTARGWTGTPRSCGPGCPVAAIDGDLRAPGARTSPQTA